MTVKSCFRFFLWRMVLIVAGVFIENGSVGTFGMRPASIGARTPELWAAPLGPGGFMEQHLCWNREQERVGGASRWGQLC